MELVIRFPFFTEMLWYMLDRYIHCLYGRTHLDLPEEEKRRLKLEKGENIDPNKEFMKMTGLSSQDMQQKGHDFNASSRSRVHLSPLELKVRAHHMFSRILNFLFVIVITYFLRKKNVR